MIHENIYTLLIPFLVPLAIWVLVIQVYKKRIKKEDMNY